MPKRYLRKMKVDGRMGSHYKRGMALLAILIMAVSSFSIWNALMLQQAIDARTMVYAGDVSLQLCSDIDYRIESITMNLKLLEDSLPQTGYDEEGGPLNDEVRSNSEMLGFTSVAVVLKDGRTYSSGAQSGDFHEMSGVQASFRGENGVTLLDEQSIVYSIPIRRDGEITGALAGVRSRENMQKLISPRSFSGRGLTCIIDAAGKVIISPTDLVPFLQLEDVFAEESGDQNTIRAIKQMQENMENRLNGAFAFTAVDGTKLILTYYPLASYDWVLLTLIPADLISQQTDTYISQTFFIIAAIILLFFAILFLIFRINREHLRQMERAAFIDRLTGAPNNAAFQMHCAKLLSQSPPNTYAIVLLDLKGFKLINENFGSEAGNATLCHIMRVLTRHVSGEEMAAHADSDHFLLCLRENDPREIQLRLERIVEEINAFNGRSEEPYYLTIRQGVYIVGEPSLEIMVIQDRARTACLASTQEGICVFYDTALTERLQKEIELNNLFEQSLEKGDFKLYLQPKVQLSSGKVDSAEALVRWQHPQRGMIYPSDFIPLFEKNGRICQLDLFIFEEVCKLLRHWMDGGKEPLPISVNLSRYHFQRQNCLDQFHEIASRYCIPRGLIEMELTESVFFDDQGIELVKMQVHKMHELGFRCSLDDFGAGYSSLGLLREFAVDVIKLDRRFFLDIEDQRAREVIISVVQLARKIGLQVVAEGIETAEQLDFLRDVECDLVQGYIYSKPLPIKDFERWAGENGWRP